MTSPARQGIARNQHHNESLHPAAVVRLLTLARDPRDATGPERVGAMHPPADRSLAEWLEAVCPEGVDVRGLAE